MVGFVTYTYFLYPVCIVVISLLRPQPVNKKSFDKWPAISIVLAAKNEESNILKRLNNLLEQDYPPDNFEIIVVSDGSEDNTNSIVSELQQTHDMHPQIQLIEYSPGRGKANALNRGIAQAKGDVIVLTDARQQFNTDAVKQLLANFSDPKVGAVSGELFFKESSDSNVDIEMGAYWKYEKLIRRSESLCASVIGATGAIYAIRKSLYKPIPAETLIDDVFIPMNVILQGYRVIFDGSAIAYDTVSQDDAQEWRRKVRTQAGNWQLFRLKPDLFTPWYNPVFVQFVSHKIFRLLVPFLLPCILMTGILLEGTLYLILTILQLSVYTGALLGRISPALRHSKIISFSYFFVMMNAAALTGFGYWVSGRCGSVWRQGYTIKEEKK